MRKLESKILNRKDAARLGQELRASGKKIISTNGCFDILHWGHLQYLEKARELGDALVVAVNADASVKKLKGPTRPIQNETLRARQLAALECVDYVMIFPEDTPEQILSELKPHIHVKGGDYTPERLPESKVVEAGGGKVVCLPLAEGFSTTSLIEKLKN